jgi:uncharacterized protein
MKCPVCIDVDLMSGERQGVEIYYCPYCRGIWLDRGELDKIIERSYHSANAPHYYGEYSHSEKENFFHVYRGHDDHHHQEIHGYKEDKHHKRKSLLKELFDF